MGRRGSLGGALLTALPDWPELTRSLAKRPTRRVRFPGLRQASVLVPLYRDEAGALRTLFTRRPTTMSKHAGQVSFPGGRLEPEEEPWIGALRETEEELGIPPERVEQLGSLSEIPVHASGYRMLPFVGQIPAGLELRPNPAEVARAFSVPLAALVDPGQVRYSRRPKVFRGTRYSIPYFEWEDELIWGATAIVLVELLEVMGLADALQVSLEAK